MDKLTAGERSYVSRLSTLDATREWAEKKIAKASSPARLAALRRIRNSTLPAIRLPSEILGQIFHGGVDDPGSGEWAARLQDITRVCYHWRSLVQNTPTFWATISLEYDSSMAFVNACVEYSGRSLLSIFINDSLRDSSVVKDLLTANADRIRLLHISENAADDFLSVLASPLKMPELEDLVLESPADSGRSFSPSPNQFGQLISLELLHVSIPWTSGVFEGLKRLSLTGTYDQTVNDFLDILILCPELRELTLSGAMVMPKNTTAGDRRTVTLSNLTRLHLSTSALVAEHLLTCLVTPSLSDFYLDVTESEDSAGEEFLIHLVLPYIRNSPLMGSMHRLEFHSMDETCIKGYTSSGSDEMIQCLVFIFDKINFSLNFDETINAFSDSVARINALKLKGLGTRTQAQYRTLFGAFPALSHVDIDSSDTGPLFLALSEAALDDPCGAPILKELHVVLKAASDSRALLKMLRMRASHGMAPLEKLSVEICYFGTLLKDEERTELDTLVDSVAIEVNALLPYWSVPLTLEWDTDW